MFDDDRGGAPDSAAPPSDDGWARFGRPVAEPGPVEPDPATVALVGAVDALLAQDASALAGPVALDRCRTVLAQTERLGVVVADALADLNARELWAADGAGSLRSWLGQQPCGDGGRSTRAGRLGARPQVRAALASGTIGVAAADLLCRALNDLPETTEAGQVEGVLTGAVPELLSRWSARNALDPSGDDPVADARAALLRETIDTGVAATALSPAERLEPALVLLGQALAPALLASQLQLIVDALVPEQLLAQETETYDNRSLRLTKKRLAPGYRLRGELTDEVGAALQAQLTCRATARKQAEAALRKAATDATGSAGSDTGPDATTGSPEGPDGADTDQTVFGTAGPGTPTTGPGLFSAISSDAVLDGPALLTEDQLAHDLLGQLLDDLTDQPGSPAPVPFTITTDLDSLQGRLGALPATLLLPDGPVPLSTDALRRMGCHSKLTAVLLDAAHTPIGASGTHRHATERQRRALRARWGHYCAINGCPSTDTVPHHVPPWWKTGRTTLADLIPICKGNHHDVHDGHRTLRLRDGRLIDENGWVRS